MTAPVAVSLASLMRRAICSLLSIMVWVKLKPLASIAFTACSVTRLTSLANSWLFAGQRGEQAARLVVEDARHLGGALAHRGGDLVGLADEVARDFGADAEQRALDLAGVLLEHIAHAGRHAADQLRSASCALVRIAVVVLVASCASSARPRWRWS